MCGLKDLDWSSHTPRNLAYSVTFIRSEPISMKNPGNRVPLRITAADLVVEKRRLLSVPQFLVRFSSSLALL